MFARAGQQKAKRNAHSSNARARNGTAKRSLLPALDMPNSTIDEDLEAVDVKGPQSPMPVMPTDAAVRQFIIDSIDDFILQLPLGTDAKAAQVEAAVSAKLLSLYLSNRQLKQRLAKWTAVAQELQEVVQQQQHELQQTRQQPQPLHQQQKSQQQYHTVAAPAVQPAAQAEAANAELRRQLQSTASRLQEVEAAMKHLMDQQSLGSNLQSAELLSEHDAANAALAAATKSATAAQQDAARLRHALLDAEIDTQRASAAAETTQRRATELEAELSKARSQIAAARCETETERRKLSAAEAAAAAAHAQLLEAQAAATKAQLQVTKAQQLAEQKQAAAQLECSSCAEKAGQLIALQGELQGLKARKSTLETALQDEQNYSKEATRRLEESRVDLERARAAVAQAEQQRDDLHVQLFGSTGSWDHARGSAAAEAAAAAGSSAVEQYPMLGWSAMAGGVKAVSPGIGGYPSPSRGSQSSSPIRQRWLLLQPPREGMMQHCSQLELRLQQQDTELICLRDQLLELQLQLADAQSAASIAQQRLQESHSKIAVAESAAADSTAAAAAATKQCEHQKQQLLQLQQQMSHLHAAKSQLEKLEAQQRVLLGDLKEYMAAAAAASAAQATAEARSDALQQQLQDLQSRHESAQKAWQQQEARLSDDNAQLSKRVAAAEAAAQSGLQQATAHYQQQLEQLAASHTARIDALRGELAADASRRADTEGKIHAYQFQHAQELAAAKADTQQHLAQQQALQQTIASQLSELSATAQKLSAAEAALAAAKAEAVAQMAAAVKEHDRMRQQLLEIRGERLQLQEQLASLQSSAGSHQQIADQYSDAEKEAAGLVDGLRQQLSEQQLHVQQLRQQIQQLQQEKAGLDAKVAEARAGRDAAAKQAATAGERLAAAVATHESLRMQLEAAGLVSGRCPSPNGSPYTLQLADSSRTITQLTRCLADTEAQLAELTTELNQSQQDNVALAHEIQRLRAELQESKARGRGSLSSTSQSSPVKWGATNWGGSGDAGAGRRSSQSYGLQGAFDELLQLAERMKSLEQHLQQQALESGSNHVLYSSSRNSGGRLASRAAGGDSSSREAVQLSTAAAAVADLRHELRRVSRDLQQQQDQQTGNEDAERLMSEQEYNVLALKKQVANLETELQSARLAAQGADMTVADLRRQLAAARSAAQDADMAVADLTSQLAAAQSAAHDMDVANADLRRQVTDLQVQLAAARSAFEASNSTADALQKLLAEVTDMKDQLDAGRQQAEDSRVSAATAAAAEAAAAAAAAAVEAERMQELVGQLQLQLEGASASAADAARSRDQVSAELRYLQTQFEDVTAELHHKQRELQEQQAEVSALKEELYSAEAAAVAAAQMEVQQIREQLLHAEDTARSDLAAAQQQVLQLQTQLQQLQDELLKQQQEAASLQEPTSTARKMQALLIQKDRDIQRLQQQVVELSSDRSCELSNDEALQLQRDGSQGATEVESSADLVTDAEHAASSAAAAGRQQQQQEDVINQLSVMRVQKEAAALERSVRPTSNSRLSSRHGSAHGAVADAEHAASSAAAVGRQQQEEDVMDRALARRVQKEPAALERSLRISSNSGLSSRQGSDHVAVADAEYAASSADAAGRQQQQEGVMDQVPARRVHKEPAALERSLRPSSNSMLSSRQGSAHGAMTDAELISSNSTPDEERQQQLFTLRSLAHIERSLHTTRSSKRESSPEDSDGAAAAAAVQQQQQQQQPLAEGPVGLDPVHLQRSLRPNSSTRSSRTRSEIAESTAADVGSGNAAVAADRSSQAKLGDQPAAAASDNLQRLDGSPSKRAAAVAAAIGSSTTSRELLKLPSSSSSSSRKHSSTDVGAMQVRAAMTAGSRLASFNYTAAAAAAADSEAVEISAADEEAAPEQRPTVVANARLSSLESARAVSRQTSSSSRAAQLAADLAGGSVAGPPAGLNEYSSSDEDSNDGVGVFGGLSHNTSTNSRLVDGSSTASVIAAFDDLRRPGKPAPDRAVRKSSSVKYAVLDGEAAGIGSLTSAIGSNIRQPSSSDNGISLEDRTRSSAVTADSSTGIGVSSGGSRAKVLAGSLAFGRGYDADKLRRSLSAGHRHTQQQLPQPPQQQQDDNSVRHDDNAVLRGGSLRLRVMSASGALEGAASRGTSSSGVAAASNYRFSGGPALKPALSTSRAARIVGVMRSVSFREPGRQ